MTESAPHHAEAEPVGWSSVEDIVISAGRGGSRGMHYGKIVFIKNIQFFHNFEPFDNNKPYAVSTQNRNCTNKMRRIW